MAKNSRKPKQRQAMSVSPMELIQYAMELIKEGEESNIPISPYQKWSLPIVNFSNESDTWKFERTVSKSVSTRRKVRPLKTKFSVV